MFKYLKVNVGLTISIILTISTSLSAGNDKETWECRDLNGEWNNILVTAIANRTTGEGIVKVAGIDYLTDFEVAGFNRQWQFGKLSAIKQDRYLFRIQPNGIAKYFNISSATKTAVPIEADMELRCRIVDSGWSIELPQNRTINTDQALSPCLPGFFIMNYDE